MMKDIRQTNKTEVEPEKKDEIIKNETKPIEPHHTWSPTKKDVKPWKKPGITDLFTIIYNFNMNFIN